MSKTIKITRVEDIQPGDRVTLTRNDTTVVGTVRDVTHADTTHYFNIEPLPFLLAVGDGYWTLVSATREAPPLPTEELASWLRDKERDHPECMHPVIAAAGRAVNDWMDDAERQRLLDLLPRALDTASDDPGLAVALAAWSAEQARHGGGPDEASARAATKAALSVAHSGRLIYYAGSAAVYAVGSLHYAGADLYAFLSGLLDEYDRLTGRTHVEPIPADRLAAAAEVAR